MKILISFILLTISIFSHATNYYVSNSGNDFNSGLTTSLPWQTLSYVNTKTFSPGDSILFKRGDVWYLDSLVIHSIGTVDNPIIYSSYGTGNNPIISEFTTVSGWVNLGNNIWESSTVVSTIATCNIVSINGVNTPMGRTPNKGTTYTITSHNTNVSITSTSLTGTPDWTGAEVVFRYGDYTWSRGKITAQSGGTLTENSTLTASDGWGFFIQNDIKTLDVQNEWYFNPTTKKITIYSVGLPTAVVKVASINNIVTFDKESYNYSKTRYITFNSIDFTGANYCTFKGFPSLVSGHQLDGVIIQNCNISFSGESAIDFIATSAVVNNNRITDTNGTAIFLSNSGPTTVKGNYIHNTEMIVGQGTITRGYFANSVTVNCYAMTGDVLIEGNTIINSGYNGIGFGNSNITTVRYNYVDSFDLKFSDGAGIGTGGTSGVGTLVTGNIVLNGGGPSAYEGSNTASSTAVGLYLDDGTQNVEASYNTVYNCTWFGIYLHNASYNNIHHNTFFNSSRQIRTMDDATAGAVSNNLINNNQFISKTSTQAVCDFNSAVGDLNIGTFDYNVYTRPIAETTTIMVYQTTGGASNKTLATWKTFSGQDAHSTTATQTISTVNDFQFEFNATNANKTVILSQPMIDVKGNKYVGSILLTPYSSVVLMKDYNPSFYNNSTVLKLVSNGKVITLNKKTLTFKKSRIIYVQNPGNDQEISGLVQNSVNIAQDGDLIILPSGTFKFSALSMHIYKNVSIKGQGINTTVLYRPETMLDADLYFKYFFYWNTGSDASSNVVVSGITFKSKLPADWTDQNGSLAIDAALNLWNLVDFVVTDCSFENFGFAAINVEHKNDLARGVICNNQFYHNYKGSHHGYGFGVCISGDGKGTGSTTWVSNPGLGTNNFIFVEDNYFYEHFQAINGGKASLFVARYNTIESNWIDVGINMHESYGDVPPARAAEIYNNIVNASKFANNYPNVPIAPGYPIYDQFVVAISPKGGDALVYNNRVSGYQNCLHAAAFPSAYGDVSYPVHYDLGYNSGLVYGSGDTGYAADHGDGDGFFWNNTLDTYQGYTPALLANWTTVQTPIWLVEDRDYHFVAKPGYSAYTYPHPSRGILPLEIPPHLSTITVEDGNKSNVVLTFDRNLDPLSYSINSFTLANKTISGINITNNILTLTISTPYIFGDAITLTYTKPSSNFIKESSGIGSVTNFTVQVKNNIAVPALVNCFTLASTGTGTGVASLTIKSSFNVNIGVDGNALFYDDLAGTVNPGTTRSLMANTTTTFYIKCTSGTANFKCTDISKIIALGSDTYGTSGWISGTNAPSLGGDVAQMYSLGILIATGNNTLSGSIAGLTGLVYTYILGSNTISGSVAGLTSLIHLHVEGSNTLSGSVAGLTYLLWLRVYGNNTLSGSIAGLTLLGFCDVQSAGTTVTYPNITNLHALDYLYISYTYTVTSANANQLLADLVANKDYAKTGTLRTMNFNGSGSSGAPTGQGITDKATLQAYHSPNNDSQYSAWTITTR
jgi:parallel beta-helix repeat protein